MSKQETGLLQVEEEADELGLAVADMDDAFSYFASGGDVGAFLDFIHETAMPLEKYMMYYKCAIMEVTTKFQVLSEQYSCLGNGNPIESVKSRLKTYDSIVRKMIRKNYERSFASIEDNINDIAGVRIICSFVDDIYHLRDSFLAQDDVVLVREKDYIKNPKASGYRALHLIVCVPIFLDNEKRPVRVEVQLRTIAMDFWASLEHKLRYKKDLPADELARLSGELEDCARQSAYLDKRMQYVRDSIRDE
jgi:putative GTP pyrophosphokinase